MSDGLIYAACDYGATGEGNTLCLLVTFAFPSKMDYDPNIPYGITEKGWVDPTVITTQEERAKRRFAELFGDWFTIGITFYERDEFLKTFKNFIPESVYQTLSIEEGKRFPMFEYYSRHHENWS